MAIIGISGKIGSGKDTVGKIIQYITSEFNGSFDEYITRDLGGSVWEIKKFATKLKQIVCLLTGCTMEQLEDQAFKNTYLPEEWDWYKTIGANSNGRPIYLRSPVTDVIRKEMGDRVYRTTYRELLQLLGTEALRNVIHENVHVNALFADYKAEELLNNPQLNVTDYSNSKFPNWLITDTRFPNEDRGGIIIRIRRIDKSKCNQQDVNGDCSYPNCDCQSTGNHPSETSLDNYIFDYVIENDGTIEELIEKVKQILIKEKII